MKFVFFIATFFISLLLVLSCVQAQTNQTVSNETEGTEPPSRGLQGYSQKQSPYEFPNETGFEHPIGNKKITAETFIEVGKVTEEGMSWLIESTASIEIELKGKEYVIEITRIEEEDMSFKIKDILEEQTIPKEEKSNYDLNADDEYDLTVLFHKQFPPGGRFADISLFLTNEKVETVAESTTTIPEEKNAEESVKEESNIGTVLTMSSVLLLAIIIFLYVILKN